MVMMSLLRLILENILIQDTIVSAFLPNLLNVGIAITTDDRMLHLAVMVAMVMAMWARRPMTH